MSRFCSALATGAFFHDIDLISTNTLPATTSTHPAKGADMLAGKVSSMARVIIGSHHENWDGSGRPKGTVGDSINVHARVLRVADAYCTATAAQPGGKCKVMIYHRKSLLAWFFWIKHALLKLKPWLSVADVLWDKMESIGTKAYTTYEVEQMLKAEKIKNAIMIKALNKEDTAKQISAVDSEDNEDNEDLEDEEQE